jgi:hypothetical protein
LHGSHGRMSGRSHRQQWRRLSVIEPDDNELPGHTNAANGRTRSTRVSRRFGTLPAFEVGEFSSAIIATGFARMRRVNIGRSVHLRVSGIVHLGKFFTVDVGIQQGHHVVQDGPYRFIRHPSYTGAMLALAGIACLTFNWLGFLVIIVCSLAAYCIRISVEEKVLLLNLGEDYRRYAGRTKRLIPGIF